MRRTHRASPPTIPLAGGVELFALMTGTPPDPRLEAGQPIPCGRFVCDLRTVDGWRFLHVWDPPVYNAPSALMPLGDLWPLARDMRDAATSLLGGPQGYLIVQAPLLQLPRAAKDEPEDKSTREAMIATRELLDKLDPLPPGQPRGYYVQYDSELLGRGYLAVGSRASVLLGLTDESFATLASLLQAGAIAPTGGFTPEGLTNAMVRVSLWSANQDIRDSVDQIRAIKRAGDDSTRGEIGVSFAIAFIGIALAFLPFLPHAIVLAPGLAGLALSGLVYARHAQRGDRLSRRAGLVLLIVGLSLIVAGVLVGVLRLPPPTLPSLPHLPKLPWQ